MLTGMSHRRPDLEQVQRIKKTLREALSLLEDATVTELTYLEEGCAPNETVIGLPRPDVPELQQKLHWGDATRRSQLVFIGRSLDEAGMSRGGEVCLA